MKKQLVRLSGVIFIVFGLLLAVAHAQESGPVVMVIDADGAISPVMVSYIQRSIGQAEARHAEALVIRLNTPGGQLDFTKQIIQAIIASDVPVIVYVWPSGGFAASAGTFITLAGDAAAMAPNTSIGAASPVAMPVGLFGGGTTQLDPTEQAKVENILKADIKGLANRRGDKAIQWAQQTISEAKAATAEEALQLGVIDFIARDMNDLLNQLNGFTVNANGKEITLATRGAQVVPIEPTWLERVLGFISDPNIALLLISVGGLAITFEFFHPTGYLSGVTGAILLLIGFYGIGQLPVNYAGLLLILLAFGLFIAEFFTHTFGALTAAGVVSFIIGAMILFNTAEFAYQLPLPSIIGIPLSLAAIFGFGIRKIWQTFKRQPTTGQEGIIGAVGAVRVALEPEGMVFVWGERWRAVSDDNQPIPIGTQVKVTALDGMRLKVKRLESAG